MCLLGLAFQTLPDCPVFLFANREESPHRQSSGPAIIHEPEGKTDWLGGIDLQAGGTWLGINQRRMIVAVTNREKNHVPDEPRSRGLLCRDLLGIAGIESAAAHAERELTTQSYAGCNFLLANPQSAIVIEAADEICISKLPPGIHLMANDVLNDPQDPRIGRVRRLLDQIHSRDVVDWIAAAETICGLTGDENEPAICRIGSDWGTASSSMVVLADAVGQSTFRHAAGPPSTTPYEDFGNLIQQL